MCLPWLYLQKDHSLPCSVVEQPCQQAPSPAVTLRGHFPAALLRASQHGPQVKLDDTCHTAAHSCPTQQLGLGSRMESGGSWGCLTEDQYWSPRGECGLVGGCSLGGGRAGGYPGGSS